MSLVDKKSGGDFAQTGFTLVELLIVITLLSLVTLLAIPLFHHQHQHVEIEHFFQLLDQDLAVAQQRALTEGKLIENEFNPVNRYYFVRERYTNEAIVRHFPEGVALSTNFPLNRLHFTTQGHISRGGRLFFHYETSEGRKSRTYIFQLGSGRYRVEQS